MQVRPNDIMEVGARVHIPVSVAESTVSKRFDVKPSATLYPNADEIEYLQRLVKYKVCLVNELIIFISLSLSLPSFFFPVLLWSLLDQ